MGILGLFGPKKPQILGWGPKIWADDHNPPITWSSAPALQVPARFTRGEPGRIGFTGINPKRQSRVRARSCAGQITLKIRRAPWEAPEKASNGMGFGSSGQPPGHSRGNHGNPRDPSRACARASSTPGYIGWTRIPQDTRETRGAILPGTLEHPG